LVAEDKDNRESFEESMIEMALEGERKYRSLTDEKEGIMDYFYEATPVKELGELNIGSRPSHRKMTEKSKYSIRAIPWVFGWSLSRHTLPAWYGLGSALSLSIGKNKSNLDELKSMYEKWPFFRVLLENIQMALSKADLDIARDYAQLVKDKKLSKNIVDDIEEEYKLTVAMLLDVLDTQELLSENKKLYLSLNRRKPYLDPLNYIQVMLLKKHREEKVDNQNNFDMLLRTIHAISIGMKNTG